MSTNWPTELAKLARAISNSLKPYTIYMKVLPSEESVEREVGDEDTVQELQGARKHKENEECVNELETVGSLFAVRLPKQRHRILGRRL